MSTERREEVRLLVAGADEDVDEHAAIEKVAYALYERRGRVAGHDVEDWLEAERLVREGVRAHSSAGAA